MGDDAAERWWFTPVELPQNHSSNTNARRASNRVFGFLLSENEF